MMTKGIGLIITAFVVSLSFAPAAFACGEGQDQTGCEPPPEEEKAKGDNGWGNGADTTNSGSFSGGTAASKSINGLGSGPAPEKFTER